MSINGPHENRRQAAADVTDIYEQAHYPPAGASWPISQAHPDCLEALDRPEPERPCQQLAVARRGRGKRLAAQQGAEHGDHGCDVQALMSVHAKHHLLRTASSGFWPDRGGQGMPVTCRLAPVRRADGSTGPVRAVRTVAVPFRRRPLSGHLQPARCQQHRIRADRSTSGITPVVARASLRRNDHDPQSYRRPRAARWRGRRRRLS
jgi:hypothetical protein